MLVKNFRLLSIVAVAIIASTLLIITSIYASYFEAPLLPASKSDYPWKARFISNSSESEIDSLGDSSALSFDFTLDDSETQFPFAMIALQMGGDDLMSLYDWSKYSSASIRIKCQPNNTVTLALYTFDEMASTLGELTSNRISTHFLTCTDQWQTTDIDLRHLKTPEWWLENKGMAYSNQHYNLSKVKTLAITSSNQSPREKYSNISISMVTLKGQSTLYPLLALSTVLFFWLGLIPWFFRCHTKKIAAQLRLELEQEASSILEPQSIDFESRHDREKYDVLRFLAREYTNPDLSMEVLVATLGINRDKINNILKQEAELTFSAYLNQLRLKEAARLLKTKEASVAEIAYAVGYKSVNYFNRLFKKAYDVTPKAYKKTIDVT